MNQVKEIRASLGEAWIKAARQVERLTERAKIARPHLLGPAIRAPLVQLYRADEDFDTEVSLVNYLSFYLLEDMAISFRMTVFDRNGHRLASGQRRVGPRQAIQVRLNEVVGAPLDAHGLFTVEATYDATAIERIAFLGQTAPQFMTLFVPRAHGASAPQILHSHKIFKKGRVPYSPCSWHSPSIERLDGIEEYSMFVLNACRSPLTGSVELRGVERPNAVWHSDYRVPGWGVSRIAAKIPGLQLVPDQPFCFSCRFDRRTPHRKPILFRRFTDGSVTGNHS